MKGKEERNPEDVAVRGAACSSGAEISYREQYAWNKTNLQAVCLSFLKTSQSTHAASAPVTSTTLNMIRKTMLGYAHYMQEGSSAVEDRERQLVDVITTSHQHQHHRE